MATLYESCPQHLSSHAGVLPTRESMVAQGLQNLPEMPGGAGPVWHADGTVEGPLPADCAAFAAMDPQPVPEPTTSWEGWPGVTLGDGSIVSWGAAGGPV
jgi:hypothetical protein